MERHQHNNDATFRWLLRFRIDSGDVILQRHLDIAKTNTTYLSLQTQNKITNACNITVVQKSVDEIRAANSLVCFGCYQRCRNERAVFCYCECEVCQRRQRLWKNFGNIVMLVQTRLPNVSQLQLWICWGIFYIGLVRGQGHDSARTRPMERHSDRDEEVTPIASYAHCSSHVLRLAL